MEILFLSCSGRRRCNGSGRRSRGVDGILLCSARLRRLETIDQPGRYVRFEENRREIVTF